MADEDVIGAGIPAPSDHKRKLDDLNSEPLDQLTATTTPNGNSDSVVNDEVPVNGVSPDDTEMKRHRFDDNLDGLEATDNAQQEKLAEEPNEDAAEQSAVERNTEQEESQGKTDEPINAVNEEHVTDETLTSAIDPQSVENTEELAKGEHQEPNEECKDPPPDATQQGDVSGVEQQPTSADQRTSRKMEVPNNKVGVLIGKAGDTIRSLQNNSGARIQITRDADADPHSATRPVELIGSLESINKAEKLIMDVIAEADAGGTPLLVARGFGNVHSSAAVEQVHIQVPNEKVGFIIGKGGETIKNLQTRSGARIQVIPQHLPEGDQSKERTMRVTGDKRQIEIAREMIKEAMSQPTRSAAPTSGFNQQDFHPRGPRSYPSQPNGYDYPQRGPYTSQNSQHVSQGYGNYPPQQPPSRNNFGWEQRPPTNMQGPPDYYGGQAGHTPAPSGPPPMHSHASGPGPTMGPPPSQGNYNYGQPQGPDYGQQPTPYPHTAPQGYSHGPPPSAYPQGTTHPGYVQQDQYSKPPTYNIPQQGPYGQPYGQPNQGQSYGPNAPTQRPYPYASSAPMQQPYTQYPAAPPQSGQTVPGYAQTGAPQQAPVYTQSGPTASYGQYPATQPGYAEQAPTANAGYGYQGAADGAYTGGPPSVGQPPAYSQPAPVQQPGGYDQSIPQSAGGYGNVPIPYGKNVSPQPQPQPQPGYAQYDNNQMYAGHR